MATYDDFDGVWFTVQSLRAHHPEARNAEIIVIDNNPCGVHGRALEESSRTCGFRYEKFTDKKGTSVRDEVFRRASGKYVMCLDSHVLLMPGSVGSLMRHWRADPESKDILSGPMMNDNLRRMSTGFKPEWRGYMYGTWHYDMRAEGDEPFETPMMGLGAFACRRETWPGFNEHFVGFGAEEGYIHEKFRLNGGRSLCVPGFRWVHRFLRPEGTRYPMRLEDRLWNYIVGWMELHRDPEHEVIRGAMEHFKERFSIEDMEEMVRKAKEIYGVA